jgi:hypothetical protein
VSTKLNQIFVFAIIVLTIVVDTVLMVTSTIATSVGLPILTSVIGVGIGVPLNAAMTSIDTINLTPSTVNVVAPKND